MKDSKVMQIAIDGPAGAGKSTIAQKVAAELGILYLDTGAMYRAIGLKALQQGIATKDADAIARLIDQTEMEIRYQNGRQHVFVDGDDVTADLRTPPVSLAASDVSSLPVVRHKLVELQRDIASRQSLVLDGRDIGTYVLPAAEHKFFLTATVAERAHRRLLDLQNRGDDKATLSEVRTEMIRRDEQDSSREMAPLRQAQDAVLIDTTGMSIEAVVAAVLSRIRQAKKS